MPDYTLARHPAAARPATGGPAACAVPPVSRLLLLKRGLEATLDAEVLTLAPGPQALRHGHRLLDHTGRDLPVDIGAVMARCSQLAHQHADELAAARAFAMTLPPGLHDIAAARPALGFFRQHQNAHRFFAIGRCTCWGLGRVAIQVDHDGRRHYALDFHFHFEEVHHLGDDAPARTSGLHGGACRDVSEGDAGLGRANARTPTRHAAPTGELHGVLRQQLRWSEGQAAAEVLHSAAADAARPSRSA